MTAMPSISPSFSHQDSRRAIDAHFAGRAMPRAESAMRAHTLECASCRSYYDRHLLLARLDPAAPKVEARIGLGLGLGDGGRRRSGRRAAWLAAFAVPAAAAMVLFARADRLPIHGDMDVGKDSGGFVARQVGSGARVPELWIYRVDAAGRTRLVTDSIQATDELAFAYANPAGKSHLLVFAVDEHRHVFWFHPAWGRGQSPPAAVPAMPGPGPHELGEAIRHALDGQRLLIRAVFADRPLAVDDVEAWDALPPLAPPEASPMVGRMLQVLP